MAAGHVAQGNRRIAPGPVSRSRAVEPRSSRTRHLSATALSAAILALAAILCGAFAATAAAHEAEGFSFAAELDDGLDSIDEQLALPASRDGSGLEAGGAKSGGFRDDFHSKNFKKFSRSAIRINLKKGIGSARAEGSDLAFKGNLMIAGAYEGLGLFRLKKHGRKMRQVSFYRCPGSQGDVTVSGDYAFVSIDSRTSNDVKRKGCNDTKTSEGKPSVGKEGLRIVDISNPRRPRQAGFVTTECGSHTQTLIPGRRTSYLYVQSYPLGPDAECNEANHDEGELSVVRFPTDAPRRARVVGVPDIFGTDGASTVTPEVVGCHDVGVLPRKDLAAAACLGAFALLDISNPAKPRTLGVVENPQMELDHSAAFTWDGKYMVIGDEHAGAAGGGGCSTDQDSPVGAMWYYKTSDVRGASLVSPATEVGSYSLPRVPPTDSPEEAERLRCTTHNYSILPMRDRDRYIAVSPYYSGGLSVVDFSNPANPKELGHYIPQVRGRNPDMWSGYWYRGKIYTNEHASKLGVSSFKMRGLSKRKVRSLGRTFNPQTQVR